MTHRIEMFKRSLPKERGEKTFDILIYIYQFDIYQEKNVLRDILEIFQNNKNNFSDYWNITFKDEVGRGPGNSAY